MIRSRSASLLALLPLLLFAVRSAAQDGVVALHAKQGQTALVEVTVKIKGSLEREIAGKTKKERLKIDRRLEFLDVVDKVSRNEQGKTAIEARRRYLRYELEENGSSIDPPVVGATLKLLAREDGQLDIKAEGDRFLPSESMNAEVRRTLSSGFCLGTDLLFAGDRAVPVDFRALGPLLVAEPGLVDKAEGELRVASRDDEKGRIELAGLLRFEHGRRRGTEDVGWKWDLQVTLTYDSGRQRIIGGSVTGTVVGAGSDRSGRISFEGEVSSKIEVDIDPKVEKEMERKVKLRAVDFSAGETGVSFQLPSSFFYYELDPERGYMFISGETGSSSLRNFAVKFDRNGDPSAAVDELAAKHRGQSAFETDKVSVKGAKGFSVLGKSQDRKAWICEDVYAARDGNIKLFYIYPVADEKEGVAEMKAIRKTIRYEPRSR